MQLDHAAWLGALGLSEVEIPRLVVVENSWWHARRNAARLSLLDDVRETRLPDMWWGRWKGQPVLYCCGWGAPRVVEPIHVAGELGTPAVIALGSCGGLQKGVHTGDVVLGLAATIGEGTSQYYGGHGTSTADPSLVEAADAALKARGLRTHGGRLVTTSALFAQPRQLVQSWFGAGHVAVDMGSSAIFSAATFYGMRAASLLVVWEEIMIGQTFLGDFTPDQVAAQDRATEAIMEVALEIGFDEGD
jgi:purine-nucleoside phosphorylase